MEIKYLIEARSDWPRISYVARTIKDLLVQNTMDEIHTLMPQVKRTENRNLAMYSPPKENESFRQYKRRVINSMCGPGLTTAIRSLFLDNEVKMRYTISIPDNGGYLSVVTATRKDSLQVELISDGLCIQKGKSIAIDLRKVIQENSINDSYDTLEHRV